MRFISNKNTFMKGFSKRQQYLTIVGFSMFFGWLLAVPFEGQVLRSMIKVKEIDFNSLYELSLASHLLGLIIGAYLIKSQMIAKITMIISSIICILGSIVFYLNYSLIWHISLISISFFAGLFVISWVMFYKIYSKESDRVKIAIDVLILSNLFMLIFDLIAVKLSPSLALFLTIAFLLGSLLLSMRLDTVQKIIFVEKDYPKKDFRNSFLTLAIFIFIATIASGFMYQIITPSYSQYPLLVAFYFVIPYILALLVIRRLKDKLPISFFLYFAIAMKGFSFLAYSYLEVNMISFIIVNTFLLASLGIFDVFLWVSLSNFIVRHRNPAKVWGYGLAVNVLGILAGGVLGNIIVNRYNPAYVSRLAIFSVFILIIILPFLIKSFENLEKIELIDDSLNQEVIYSFELIKEAYKLTDREIEVIKLVMKGYTYKAIAEELNITENTVKYHSKNIYSKLDVNTKMKLIEKLENTKPTQIV